MKSRTLTCITAITLFAALAIPVRLAAQDDAAQTNKPKHQHYKLIDMGTFGGPSSFINEPSNFVPAVNKRGMTVGGSGTPVPTTSTSNPTAYCGGFNGVVPNVYHAFEWRNGTVSDLGSLAGPNYCSDANSINARGEIEGVSENGVVDPILGLNEIRAVVWKHGQMIDLGTLGGNHSWSWGINNSGQVVGMALNAIPDPYSMYDFGIFGSSTGTQTRAFLWDKENGMQDLGTLGGPDAWASSGINERGQVAGGSYTNSTPNPATGVPPSDPFLWEEGKGMTDLGTLGGDGFAQDINNRGQVIGYSSLAGGCLIYDPNCHPFLWDQGKLTDLNTGTAGGNPQTSDAINDAGEIVGGGAFPGRVFDAYLWRNGAATDLGYLNGDCYSEGSGINLKSQVVGVSVSCDGNFHHAFLWENGSITDLNTQIPPGSALELVWGIAINARGEIAGIGVPTGVPPANYAIQGHAFLLIPCDEDHRDVEDCDYSMVETASGASSAQPAVRGASVQMPPSALWRRNSRIHLPGPSLDPRN
jgi:probable HAF family extracellular repeat protein